jgi:amino acid adenylation domain-containing protein
MKDIDQLSPGEKRALLERLLEPRPRRDVHVAVPDDERTSEPFPLTEIQQAYLFGRHSIPGRAVGIHGFAELECDDLDVDRLEEAWRRVIARHGMLRARPISETEQRIRSVTEVPAFRIIREPAERLDAVRRELSHQVLPLDGPYLFDFRACRLTDRSSRLFLSVDLLNVDLGSLMICLDEWIELYRHPDAALPKVELSFRDYVLAAGTARTSPDVQRAREYWQQRITDLPGEPELPWTRALCEVDQVRFRRRTVHTSRESFARFEDQARRRGLTPSAVLLSVYAEILRAYARSSRFTINVTLFNRIPVHRDVGSLVGDFTSTLLVSCEPAGGFTKNAEAVQRRIWESLEHYHVGGVEVMRMLNRSRRRGSNADMTVVFTSGLGLERRGYGLERLGRVVDMLSQTPHVRLDCQVVNDGHGGVLHGWDSVDASFPPGVVGDMISDYRQAVVDLGDDRSWRRSSLHRVPEAQLAQRQRVTVTAPAPFETLHAPFDRSAQAAPDAEAVLTLDDSVRYIELKCASDALAAALTEREARGRCVAIVMNAGWEQIAGVLATSKAGAAYLPIPADQPPARIAQLLDDGEVSLVLTQPEIQPGAWAHGRTTIVVDESLRAANRPCPSVDVSPSDLAYVIYTSGTTGRPKGVMIEHAAAMNTIVDINVRLGVRATDRVLALSSLAFDLSVYDVFGMLAAGGALVLPSPRVRKDPRHWAELIDRHRPSIWNSVPALMQVFLDDVPSPPRGLRVAMLSGDWIPLELPARIRGAWPQCRVMSLGGATEGSIWSIAYDIGEVEPSWKSIPYGTPLTNQRVRVLDDQLDDRPDFVVGEICIGGAGVAEGYWRNPDQTEAKFVRHPTTGERWYRTGDDGRHLPGGEIEILGRRDLQVKIRGHRVELQEIEHVLRSHPLVREAVVTVRGARDRARDLIAHVIPESASTDELRAFLRERLPGYMVPAHIIGIERLPLTSNGKVDRDALTAAPAAAEDPHPRSGFGSDIERRLTVLLQEVLGVDRVGLRDNFYDLGGNSIHMITARRRIATDLGVDVPVVQILEHPTIEALAQFIGEGSPKEDVGERRERGERRRGRLSGRRARRDEAK